MANDIRSVFSINEIEIKADANGHFGLTKIWQASKTPASKRPAQYLRTDSANEFIESRAEILSVQKCTLTSTKKGKHGGVWADIQVALAYAQWIDPVFHQVVNEAYLTWHEEERDTDLKVSRAVSTYKKRGLSDEAVAERLAGMFPRKTLCDALQEQGCTKGGDVWTGPYHVITNLCYETVTGLKTAQSIKARRSATKGQSARDCLTPRELGKVAFLESEIAYEIRERNAQGNDECIAAAWVVCKRYGLERSPTLALTV
jgi:hypothetical protein